MAPHFPTRTGREIVLAIDYPEIEPNDIGLWGEEMTVCVAAICEDSKTILGASDRMITAGIVQFQPAASKAYQITKSIVIMVAGEMTVQTEIMAELVPRVNVMLSQDPPPGWLNVKDIADVYASIHDALKTKRGERDILLPLGLTSETFISRQRELAPKLVTTIATELIGKTLPSTAAIVSGVDNTGAHLYVVEGGNVTCHDAAGFASIGAGWYHASSHMMFSRHEKNGSLARTLLLTYTAKKRAEVAPGVGIETDMYSVRGLGNYFEVGTHVIGELQVMYETAVAGHAEVERVAERKAYEYIEEISRPREQAGQASEQAPDPAPPVDDAPAPGPE
ncbi:MAG: hypothetical protein ABI790_11785 [Betaproteobacteria bacterium]